MKDTGPEAAEAAGLPWDEVRWKNDPAYNFALGKAYLNKQLKRFGGIRFWRWQRIMLAQVW